MATDEVEVPGEATRMTWSKEMDLALLRQVRFVGVNKGLRHFQGQHADNEARGEMEPGASLDQLQ